MAEEACARFCTERGIRTDSSMRCSSVSVSPPKAPRNIFGVHADMVTYGKSLAGDFRSASSAAA